MRDVQAENGRVRRCLETWGEIAAHLGVEIRTAQRWEKRMRLPIRRLKGSQAVYAFADELDEWRASQEEQTPTGTPVEELGAPEPTAVSADPPLTHQTVGLRDELAVPPPVPVAAGRRPERWRAWVVGLGMAGCLAAGIAVPTVLLPAVREGWARIDLSTSALTTPDTFDIVGLNPPAGSVAFGGNVEPEWGVYVTLQYSLRSHDTAWLCIIAEVDPVARSGSVCGDPVVLRRGTGTARTRVVVTNTTANGPVLTKRLRLIASAENLCRPVPGNYNTHDASCFPNPFLDRFEDVDFAWTNPGAPNRVGVLAVSAPADAAVPAGREVSVTVSYLLQDAPRAQLCVRPVTNTALRQGRHQVEPAGPPFRCSDTEVRAGFGTTAVSFTVNSDAVLPVSTAGLWIEMKGLYVGYHPLPLNWTMVPQ